MSSLAPWNISELLLLIISFLDQQSLARAARVCRSWSHVALDALWRDVDDLPRLLALLCPYAKPSKLTTKYGGTISTYKFKRPLTANDWTRFQHYSFRVRRIVYDQRTAKSWRMILDDSIFREIFRTSPTSFIFPNLRSLTWNADSEERQLHVLHFLHPWITELEMQLHHVSSAPSSFFDQVSILTPHLTRLTLRLSTPIHLIEDDVVPFLLSLRKLQFFSISPYGLSTKVVEALSRLGYLKDVSLLPPGERGKGNRADVLGFQPLLKEGAFPATQRICFSADILHATRLISSPFFPSQLSRLYIHVLSIAHADVLQQLFATIRDSCPMITDLRVDFMIHPHVPLSVPGWPLSERPNIATFRPLFDCRRITAFEFRWDYALNLTDEDMEEFAVAWPRLEHFLLNCEPIIEFNPPLATLAALLPFARHCPRLHTLGLYMDADSAPSDVPALPFVALRELMVGASNINDIDSVTLFLSKLCPLDCKLVAGVRWPDAYGTALDCAGILDERRPRMCEYWVLWTRVVEMLPVVIRARMQERSLRAEMQREVDRLALEKSEEAGRYRELQKELLAIRVQRTSANVASTS